LNKPPLPGERKFGALFTVVFGLLAAWAHARGDSGAMRNGFLVIALALLALTLVQPKLLAPFNRAWFALGLLLGRIVSPIVLGAMFFLLITPVALATRLFGRDALRLKRQTGNSCWIARENDLPPAESFKNQF
jgi:Saxitoxin biosynthesis operon protein SxtJ